MNSKNTLSYALSITYLFFSKFELGNSKFIFSEAISKFGAWKFPSSPPEAARKFSKFAAEGGGNFPSSGVEISQFAVAGGEKKNRERKFAGSGVEISKFGAKGKKSPPCWNHFRLEFNTAPVTFPASTNCHDCSCHHTYIGCTWEVQLNFEWLPKARKKYI